jgi:hypothetical protein
MDHYESIARDQHIDRHKEISKMYMHTTIRTCEVPYKQPVTLDILPRSMGGKGTTCQLRPHV